MSTFALRMGTSGGAEMQFGAVARVQGYASADPKSVVYRQISIPISDVLTSCVDVPAGRYVIQVILPSGRMLSEERQVGEGDLVSVVFANPARRDWLGWQDYAAATPRSDLPAPSTVELSRLGRIGRRMQSLPYLDRIFGAVMGAGSGETANVDKTLPGTPVVSIACSPTSSDENAWTALAQSPPVLGPNEATFAPVRKEGPLALYDLRLKKLLEGRPWVVVAMDDALEIVSLPFDRSGAPPPSAELLVDQRAAFAVCRSSLVVRDAESAPLLAFLGRGNAEPALEIVHGLSRAGSSLNRGQGLLPFTFCAAAYIRLMNDETAPPEQSSLEEAAELFPWLPDAAVIRTQAMIRNGGDRDDIVRALRSAYERGVPYFSAGVQHLREAMGLFSAADGEVAAMASAVAMVASRMDPGKPFTALRYSRRAQASALPQA